MSSLNGSRSFFQWSYTGSGPFVNYPVDDFDTRYTADVIASNDWNALGDAVLNLEKGVKKIKSGIKETDLNVDCDFWCGNLPIVWTYIAGEMSATGKVEIPQSVETLFDSLSLLQDSNLVKVQLVVDTVAANRLVDGGNLTTAIWCPLSADSGLSYTNPTRARTIYVGVSFDGFAPPSWFFSATRHVSILLMSPGQL